MRLFSLVAALAAMGACYAGSIDRVGQSHRQNIVSHKVGGPARGLAIMKPPKEPLEVKGKDSLNLLTIPKGKGVLHDFTFQDGVFTAQKSGRYFIECSVDLHAKAGSEYDIVWVRLKHVNNGGMPSCHLMELPYSLDLLNSDYPVKFQGYKHFSLMIEKGDKVFLQIYKIHQQSYTPICFVDTSSEYVEADPAALLHLYMSE